MRFCFQVLVAFEALASPLKPARAHIACAQEPPLPAPTSRQACSSSGLTCVEVEKKKEEKPKS